jgi:Tfp pilus assembly protein PilF
LRLATGSPRNAFSAVAGTHPSLAEPHIYLGHRPRRKNLPAASAELRRAVELEPENYLASQARGHLLVTGQPDLARSFYQRAIELQPE